MEVIIYNKKLLILWNNSDPCHIRVNWIKNAKFYGLYKKELKRKSMLVHNSLYIATIFEDLFIRRWLLDDDIKEIIIDENYLENLKEKLLYVKLWINYVRKYSLNVNS